LALLSESWKRKFHNLRRYTVASNQRITISSLLYDVLTAVGDNAVKEAIDDGWTPYGPPSWSEKKGCFVWCMILKHDEPKPKKKKEEVITTNDSERVNDLFDQGWRVRGAPQNGVFTLVR
jgi:hypothetical protein